MNHPLHSAVLFSIADFHRMVESGVFDGKSGKIELMSLKFDTSKKQQLYALDKFAEYWVVDAESESVIVHVQPTDESYTKVTTHTVGESISPQYLPDAKLDLEWLFRG